MRHTSLLSVVLLASACTTGPSLSSKQIEVRPIRSAEAGSTESAYEVAKRQLELNNVGLAVDAFRKAVRENPTSSDALNGLAVAYDRMGRYDLSRQAYEEALALAPSDTAILHNLQLSLIAQGRHSEATRLAAETGTAPIAVAEARPVAPQALPKDQENTGARLERVSLREVSLVTAPAPKALAKAADAERPLAKPTSPVLAVASSRASTRKTGAVEVSLPPPTSSGPLVTVLNAAGRQGLARRTSAFLQERGWNKTIIANAQVRPAFSLLIHAPQDRLQAMMLAKTLPFRPRLVAAGKARSIILLLGRNAGDSDYSGRVSST